MSARSGRVPASSLLLATSGRRFLLGFVVVLLVAAGHAAHDATHGSSVWRSIVSSAAIVVYCAVLSAGYFGMVRWKVPRWALLTAGVLASAAFGVLFMGLHEDEGRWSPMGVAGSAIIGLSITSLWLLVFQLPAILYRARLDALEAENLRREAELSRLRVHLHPHFLLNTLNAIAGLVTEDTDGARRLIAALGDLVRDALSGGDDPRPFSEEAAWLRRYAEILEIRHRGFLSFEWEIAEETLDALVPRLLLQPLVENAVKHGALRRREGGVVLIRGEMLSEEMVRFIIEDNGPGMEREAKEGLGISLVRRRLALMCPGGGMSFVPMENGTRVVVEIPKPPKE